MRNINEVLEFNRVLTTVAGYALTSSAKQRLLALTMSNDYYRIEEDLAHADEAIRITYSFGRCPIEYVHEIEEPINRAHKGATLNCEELYHIASQYEGILKVQNFAGAVKAEHIENFKYLVDSLNPVRELKREVDRCISPNLTIYDHASTTLANIRKELVAKEAEVRHKLDQYLRNDAAKLSDSLVTIRNERLVIPVKSSYKYDFGGIIHDQSDSGQTFYVEPEAVVTINSQLQVLHHREAEEIERILASLTGIVRANEEILLANFKHLVELDFLFAKGQYAKELDAKVATLSKTSEIYLIKARHPLLERKTVVANDFILGGAQNKIVLVTGPNTGGKTVALKTVGLLVMMNQAGLAIPVDFEARLGVFDNIYVDIGDEQSIEQSLSTFSSHLSKIVAITKAVTKDSLVLVDELGGGTDPSEGEALAMAILDYFHTKQSLVLATTHYSNLKSYAIEVGYVTNASMLFDADHLQPTYRLIYGVPGRSYAFMISRRLGLAEEIVSKGEQYQKHFLTESDLLIAKLQKELEAADAKQAELKAQAEELQEEKQRVDEALVQVQNEKQELVVKSHEKIDELVASATAEINEIINAMKVRPSSEVKMHEWIAAKKRLEDVSVFEIDEEKQELHDYEVGETIFVPRLNKTGKVVRKHGNEYFVNIGKITMSLDAHELAKHEQVQNETKVSIQTASKRTAVSMECNLIGLHVDEAMQALEKYLDDALLMHYHEVRIIHGFGSGALRKAVHAYLDKQKYVKDYRMGGAGEGGLGATVVHFKE